MLCPNCGRENISGVDLCEFCGTDLAGLDIPEAQSGFGGRMSRDRVAALPLVPALLVPPDCTVSEAILLMRDARHGCVLVAEEGRLGGIFTERDVLTRVIRPGMDPEKVIVNDVMTPDPVCLSPTDPTAYAINLSAARGLRHLPVVDGGRLLGFISVRGLLRYIHADVIGNQEGL